MEATAEEVGPTCDVDKKFWKVMPNAAQTQSERETTVWLAKFAPTSFNTLVRGNFKIKTYLYSTVCINCEGPLKQFAKRLKDVSFCSNSF